MTPLEILRRQFRTVAFPRPGELRSGVYLLIDDSEVFYCGASRNVFQRVGTHLNEYEFTEALRYPLPWAVVFDYEGAFTRFLNPSHNECTSRYRGHDNEILEGFGLPPHRDQDAVARQWRADRHARVLAARHAGSDSIQ